MFRAWNTDAQVWKIKNKLRFTPSTSGGEAQVPSKMITWFPLSRAGYWFP